MPQRQDDGVEVTLGNQTPDSCPREREMAQVELQCQPPVGVTPAVPIKSSSPGPALVCSLPAATNIPIRPVCHGLTEPERASSPYPT